jgi:hypothetical protein
LSFTSQVEAGRFLLGEARSPFINNLLNRQSRLRDGKRCAGPLPARHPALAANLEITVVEQAWSVQMAKQVRLRRSVL